MHSHHVLSGLMIVIYEFSLLLISAAKLLKVGKKNDQIGVGMVADGTKCGEGKVRHLLVGKYLV